MKAKQICPICGSEDFTVDNSNAFLEQYGSSTNYLCNRCKNSFPIPIELDEDISKEVELAPLTEDIKKSTPKEMRVGAGYAWVIIVLLFAGITIVLIIIALFFRG